jgi:glycosyltransferase involved in cell wall biosynthesis
MKILYVVHQFYPRYRSGTERVTYNLASMMQIAGNRVKVVTYCVDHDCPVIGEYRSIKYNEYIYRKIPVLEFFLDKEPPNFHLSLYNEDVINFAKQVYSKEKPDVVHICHPMRVCGFLAAAQEMGIPCVVTATDLMYICPKIIMNTMKGELCKDAERGRRCNIECFDTGNLNVERMELSERLLTGSAFVVAPSEFISYMIKKQIPNVNCRIIKHGMDYSNVKQQSKVYKKNDQINFGYVGSIQEHKGVHYVIDSFMEIDANSISLSIYGDYSNNYGQKLARKAKKDSRIRFFGGFESDKIEEVYNEIDVLVVPSLCYESYSLVKHEAIMRNIPVIVSDVGALGDGIEHGVNGYKFSLEDRGSLCGILSAISKNPEKLNDIKSELSYFAVPTIEQESFQYYTLYKKCKAKNSKKEK